MWAFGKMGISASDTTWMPAFDKCLVAQAPAMSAQGLATSAWGMVKMRREEVRLPIRTRPKSSCFGLASALNMLSPIV